MSLCLQLISDICQLFLNKTGKNLYSGIEYKVRSTNMGNLKYTKILLCEDTVKRMKRSFTNWENICKSPIWQRACTQNIKNTQIQQNLNRCFTKGDTWEVNQSMKICSASLAIREIQIKTRVRYHHEPTTMAKF